MSNSNDNMYKAVSDSVVEQFTQKNKLDGRVAALEAMVTKILKALIIEKEELIRELEDIKTKYVKEEYRPPLRTQSTPPGIWEGGLKK